MTNLDEMWAELERYQSYADRKGFGPAWRRMCEKRTAAAAYAAFTASSNSKGRLGKASKAAWEAGAAVDKAWEAKEIVKWKYNWFWFTKWLPPYPCVAKSMATGLSHRATYHIQCAIKEERDHGS